MADPTAKITAVANQPNAQNPKRQDLIVTVTINVNGVDYNRTFVFVADDTFIFHDKQMPTADEITKRILVETNKLQALSDLVGPVQALVNIDLVAANKGK